jgi:hypothetical protein
MTMGQLNTSGRRFVLAAMMLAIPNVAHAQSVKDLIGTWTLVADVLVRSDGTRADALGPEPKGILIFDANGRFATILTRAELPLFASNNRMQGTAEENKAIVQGSIAYFGTYTMADKVITQHVEGGTWPSWNGTDQRRILVSLTADELKWQIPAASIGTTEVTWKRAN